MIKFTNNYDHNHINLLKPVDLSHYVKSSLHELDAIRAVVQEIQANAQVLLVIGVGGSFLGARAVIDALTPYFGLSNGVEVVYAGQNMSGAYLKQLLTYLDSKEVYVNVISKSGSTMEPALAFRVVKEYMDKRYDFEVQQRIIVTTDAKKGVLKEIADEEGYRQFVVPEVVGGRYSVFTSVGLLPIAVAGINVEQFVKGAEAANAEFSKPDVINNIAAQYASTRFTLYKKGYSVELLASFEPRLNKLHEWWKQLFGESEGKEHNGLYPSTVNYSTDLHAIGQFIQDGSRIMFETLIHFKEIEEDIDIPFNELNKDGLNYLAGRSLNEINATSKDGVALAHEDGGVPVIQIELDQLDAYHIGYLMMFFMHACVMSASLLEVNPFDQPGVEAYKQKMVQLLKRNALIVSATV